MKILIVSWYFPPCSTMGALRVGKFAKYLVGEGHDVRIVCARDQPYAMDHPVEVPAGIIHYTPWWDVNWLPAKVQSLRVWLGGRWRRITQQATAADASGAASSGGERVESRRSDGAGFLRRVLNFYRHATNIPDGMIGWLLPALLAARTVTTGWTPDIVFASAPPFTTLIAGRMIAKRVRAPLVVEYRDRWMEDPYGDGGPPLRRWIDRRLEKWCAAAACGVVTVSDPWADDYRARWNKPVAVAYNGYDPDDVAAISDATPADSDKLVILYTGIIYPERRDPTPLFEALALMGDDRKSIRVDFLGAIVDQLAAMVQATGQQDLVFLRPGVPFAEALRRQRAADVLLLLQWNNVLEAGNVPGKLFEYLAARRPVLGIGYENGVPARLLNAREAGRVLNDPQEIAAYLRLLLERKRLKGQIPLLPESVSAGLSRPEQYAQIVSLFGTVSGIAASRA